jgi:hypothetical protein
MAGIRTEEVNRPREVRAYGLTPGIGGAYAIGWISTLRTKISVKSKSVKGWRILRRAAISHALRHGLRNRPAGSGVKVTIGGISSQASYAGQQGAYPGLDQINVALDRALVGRGVVDVSVVVNGRAGNVTRLQGCSGSGTPHGLHGGPRSPSLADWTILAAADHGDFLENPHCKLFYGIDSVEIIAHTIDGERGKPESNLGSLLRELIHLSVPNARRVAVRL